MPKFKETWKKNWEKWFKDELFVKWLLMVAWDDTKVYLSDTSGTLKQNMRNLRTVPGTEYPLWGNKKK